MTTYQLQGPPHAGAQITMATPGGTIGDLAVTGQGCGLLIQNSGTVPVTVVLPFTPVYDGTQAISSRIVTCPAAVGAVDGITLIPLPDSVYGPGTTAVQYSATANIAVASVRIP